METNEEVTSLLKIISYKLSNISNNLSKIVNQYDDVNKERMNECENLMLDDKIDEAMNRYHLKNLTDLEERITNLENEIEDLQTRIESVNSKLNFADRYNYQNNVSNGERKKVGI